MIAIAAASAHTSYAAPGATAATSPQNAAVASLPVDDGEFRRLFLAWKALDDVQPARVSVPSTAPLDGYTLTSVFGLRPDPFGRGSEMHAGLDMASPAGTPVHVTAAGVVIRAGWSGGYGNLIEIDHGGGIHTRYGHLSRILVSPKQRVARGDLIGNVGSTGRSTGNHLHYEVRLNDLPIDPQQFLDRPRAMLAFIRTPTGSSARIGVAVGGP